MNGEYLIYGVAAFGFGVLATVITSAYINRRKLHNKTPDSTELQTITGNFPLHNSSINEPTLDARESKVVPAMNDLSKIDALLPNLTTQSGKTSSLYHSSVSSTDGHLTEGDNVVPPFTKTQTEPKTILDLPQDVYERLPIDLLIKNSEDKITFFSKDRKSEGAAQLNLEQKNHTHYMPFISEEVLSGNVFIPDLEPEDLLDKLLLAEKLDRQSIEFHHISGAVMRRTTHFLPDESILFLREDVSKDHLAKEALDLRNQQLDAILDTTSSCVCGLDSEKKIVFANNAATKFFNLPDQEVVPWPTEVKFLSSEDHTELRHENNPVNQAIAGELIEAKIFLLRTQKSKPTRYVKLSCAPINSLDLDGLCTVLIIEDVSNQEIGRQKFERQGRLDALGQLTGGIAHDFNNLLSTIEYSISLAIDETDLEEKHELLSIASKSVSRGASLTKRLLTFAKQQPGLARQVVLSEFFKDFSQLARPAIEEEIEIEYSLNNKGLAALCDPNQLENALLNLVLNSRDAILRTHVGGSITIYAEIANQHKRHLNSKFFSVDAEHFPDTLVAISVSDDGPGMTKDVLNRATDPFFTTKSAQSGSGLGLSMVYGFVEQAGGDMRIHSEDGLGTTVTLFLPVGHTGQTEIPSDKTRQHLKGDDQKILIVEDEAALLNLMQKIVSSLNYQVICAENGKAAIDQLKSHPDISLVITDIMMPGGMSGYDVAKEAREILPSVPILYLSGYADQSSTLKPPVQATMLQKPVRSNILANEIMRALNPEQRKNRT